ncbi:hypothetical protein AX15_004487 [Amanita polypyramis BW_CC]|nr:hypothetical protein AX15_004487 [Amanita polypyramis BW_CC]
MLLRCSVGRPVLSSTLQIPRRTLFSALKIEPQCYREQKVLPYGQVQLYNVVSDVSSYPCFVPFCTASHITKPLVEEKPGSGVHVMEAELAVGFRSFKESYVSKVTCIPFTSVLAEASCSTPLFKALKTSWTFQPASSRASTDVSDGGPTLVTLDLVYAFANPLHAVMSATFFGQISKQMVRAFEERCRQVYGHNE